jgi:hypothetical protein
MKKNLTGILPGAGRAWTATGCSNLRLELKCLAGRVQRISQRLPIKRPGTIPHPRCYLKQVVRV